MSAIGQSNTQGPTTDDVSKIANPSINNNSDNTIVNNNVEEVWTKHTTAQGVPYYYNTKTKESTWKLPTENPEDPKIDQPIKALFIRTTRWKLVFTKHGYRFFYDTQTKESSWEHPQELQPSTSTSKSTREERKEEHSVNSKHDIDNQEISSTIANLPDQIQVDLQEPKLSEAGSSVVQGTELTEEDVAYQLQMLQQEQGNLSPQQCSKTDSSDTEDSGGNGSDGTSSNSDDEEHEQGHQLLKDKHLLTQEEKIQLFKDMLTENQVGPFDSWDSTAKKLMGDPRYSLIESSKECKNIFDQYCRQTVKANNYVPKQKLIKQEFHDLIKSMLQSSKQYKFKEFNKKVIHLPICQKINYKERERIFLEVLDLLEREESASKYKSDTCYKSDRYSSSSHKSRDVRDRHYRSSSSSKRY